MTFDRDLFQYVFLHDKTGIRVWTEAIDVTAGLQVHVPISRKCMFHYTSLKGGRCITNPSQNANEVRATLMTELGVTGVLDAFYGNGVYATAYEPAALGSVLAVLYNNYYGAIMMKKDREIKERWHCAQYVIPLLVAPHQFTDVALEVTE